MFLRGLSPSLLKIFGHDAYRIGALGWRFYWKGFLIRLSTRLSTAVVIIFIIIIKIINNVLKETPICCSHGRETIKEAGVPRLTVVSGNLTYSAKTVNG